MDRPTPHDPQVLLSHLGWLRMLARQLVHDQHLADDLAQDAYVVALQTHPADPKRLRSWLGGILGNLALSRTRLDARRSQREDVVRVHDRYEAAGALVERVEAQGELVRLVLELDEPLRDVVLMHYFDERPLSAVASELGITRATAFRRLQRAHEQLRGRLERTLGRDPGLWSMVLLGLPLEPQPVLASKAGSLLAGSKLALGSTVVVAGGALVAVLALRPWESARPSPLAAAEPATPRAPAQVVDQVPAARREAVAREAFAQPIPSSVPAVAPVVTLDGRGRMERDRERVRLAMEATLRGDVDLGAFVDLALAACELEPAARALPVPQVDGSVRHPLRDAPPGYEVVLKVDATRNPQYSPELCSLRIRLDPPDGATVSVEGSARRVPEVELTAFTHPDGELEKLVLVTDFQVSASGNRALGIDTTRARIPLSFSFSYHLRDPLASTARMTWVEGDVRARRDVDWRLVGSTPQAGDLARLSARLQELRASLR